MTDTERLLAPDYLDDLSAKPIDEIRRMRAECIEVETGLSYLRRLVQGPLDIVHREQAARASGETDHDLAHLVEELAVVLADGTRSGGVGRLPQTLEPTSIDGELAADLDGVLAGGRLARVPTVGDDELSVLEGELAELEHRVSARRRAFHERIDALQAELTRRYQTGEASVESLLEEPRP